MTPKHTPGPWAIRGSEYTQEIVGPYLSNKHICETTGAFMDKRETWANARLIACAPELLEALSEIVAEFDNKENGFERFYKNGIDTAGIQWARDAIAKAEGRE